MKHISNLLKQYKSGLLISIASAFMLSCFAPIDIYWSNSEEFWFGLRELITIAIVCFFILAFVNSIILILIHSINIDLYRVVVCIQFIVFVSIYVQGNFLAYNIPVLNGEVVDWNKYLKDSVIFLFIFFILLIVFGVLSKSKDYKYIEKIEVITSLLLFGVFLVSIVIETSIGIYNSTQKVSWVATEDHLFEMSPDRNFIILLLDYTDGEDLKKLLEKHPEYKQVFNDFTFYDDAMGMYSYTYYSIPLILTGERYEYQSSLEKYTTEGMNSSQLFRALENNGYEMNLYENQSVLNYNDRNVFKFKNIKDKEQERILLCPYINAWKNLIGYRYSPFFLKQYFSVGLTDFSNARELENDDVFQVFDWSDHNFYLKCDQKQVALVDQKQFKFIHLQGAHKPYKLVKMQEADSATYDEMLESCCIMVDRYLKKLKESSVYDNTAIIIMADHGRNDIETEGRLGANPIFFAKGIDEHHEMYYSGQKISYLDLHYAFNNILNGENGMEIFKGTNFEKERFFLLQEQYEGKQWPLIELSTRGAAYTEDFSETGVVYRYKCIKDGKYYIGSNGQYLSLTKEGPQLVDKENCSMLTIKSANEQNYYIFDDKTNLYLSLKMINGVPLLTTDKFNSSKDQEWFISTKGNYYVLGNQSLWLSYNNVDGRLYTRTSQGQLERYWSICKTKSIQRDNKLSEFIKSGDLEYSYIKELYNSNTIFDYLDVLNKNKNNLNIYFAVKDNASYLMNDVVIEKLSELGIKNAMDLREETWERTHSFIACVECGNVTYECIGNDEKIEWFLPDKPMALFSCTLRTGDYAGIEIMAENYAVNIRGLNIVTIDPQSNKIIDSVTFDTNDVYDAYVQR